MMKCVDVAAFALTVMGCVTTADVTRPCPLAALPLPTHTPLLTPLISFSILSLPFLDSAPPPFSPAGPLRRKGETGGPQCHREGRKPLCNEAYHFSAAKINKPASPGPKKHAPPKGSLVLTLSRHAEYLIILECQERQGSALATRVCVGEETGCA